MAKEAVNSGNKLRLIITADCAVCIINLQLYIIQYRKLSLVLVDLEWNKNVTTGPVLYHRERGSAALL